MVHTMRLVRASVCHWSVLFVGLLVSQFVDVSQSSNRGSFVFLPLQVPSEYQNCAFSLCSGKPWEHSTIFALFAIKVNCN